MITMYPQYIHLKLTTLTPVSQISGIEEISKLPTEVKTLTEGVVMISLAIHH